MCNLSTVRAAKLRSLTKAIVVSQYPRVEDDQRYAWEAYSDANNAWVEEGLRVQRENANFEGKNVDEWSGWG